MTPFNFLSKLRAFKTDSQSVVGQKNSFGSLETALFYINLWYFSKQSPEVVILILAACPNNRVKKYVELYFTKYFASAKINLNGDDLIEMGMVPDSSFNDIFKALRDARINGHVTSRDEEVSLVESQFLK